MHHDEQKCYVVVHRHFRDKGCWRTVIFDLQIGYFRVYNMIIGAARNESPRFCSWQNRVV